MFSYFQRNLEVANYVDRKLNLRCDMPNHMFAFVDLLICVFFLCTYIYILIPACMSVCECTCTYVFVYVCVCA